MTRPHDHRPPRRTGSRRSDVAEARSRVADVADRARQRNLDRAEALADWVRAAGHGPLTRQDREVAADVAHQLAGSAGTFGYLAATDLARRIEQCFLDGRQDAAEENVRELIRRLHEPPDTTGV